MTFVPTAAEVLGLVCLALLAANGWQWLGNEHIRRVMRTAIEKSESDGSDYCRIPRNQCIEMMQWQSMYALLQAGHEFKGKPDLRHPSTLTPTRRRKLRK